MATTIASIETADAGGGVLAVTITLSNGLLETFYVTTAEDGTQTWATADGRVVATVPAGSGTLPDAVVALLIQQITADARRTLIDIGVARDLDGLSSDQLADVARGVEVNLAVGNNPNVTPPSKDDLQRELDAQLLDGVTQEQLTGTLADISIAEGADGQTLVTVTLTSGATETFVVTTENGFETFSTLDGAPVASFDPGHGSLADERGVIQTLVIQTVIDNPMSVMPGAGTPSNSGSPGDAPNDASNDDGANSNTNPFPSLAVYEQIYFTFYLQALLEGMSPADAAAYAKEMADAATGQGDGDEDNN
jgi:hypothetical protein